MCFWVKEMKLSFWLYCFSLCPSFSSYSFSFILSRQKKEGRATAGQLNQHGGTERYGGWWQQQRRQSQSRVKVSFPSILIQKMKGTDDEEEEEINSRSEGTVSFPSFSLVSAPQSKLRYPFHYRTFQVTLLSCLVFGLLIPNGHTDPSMESERRKTWIELGGNWIERKGIKSINDPDSCLSTHFLYSLSFCFNSSCILNHSLVLGVEQKIGKRIQLSVPSTCLSLDVRG